MKLRVGAGSGVFGVMLGDAKTSYPAGSSPWDLPGHRDSPGWPAYDVESLTEGVHRAVEAAGLSPPVVVGHSMSAVIATVYGARYPTQGVINVDQPLEVESFARLVESLADDLRGARFAEVWERFEAQQHARRAASTRRLT